MSQERIQVREQLLSFLTCDCQKIVAPHLGQQHIRDHGTLEIDRLLLGAQQVVNKVGCNDFQESADLLDTGHIRGRSDVRTRDTSHADAVNNLDGYLVTQDAKKYDEGVAMSDVLKLATATECKLALKWAADNGAKIINLSLGGTYPSSVLEDAVTYATSRGVIVIAAAGNTGQEGVLYPAAYGPVIAVASVDPNLQRSNFSSYGPQIDLFAPGRDILTTKREGGYGSVSGTSFAAPHVAGAASPLVGGSR